MEKFDLHPSEMDKEGMMRLYKLAKEGNAAHCEDTEARGLHHKFYADKTCQILTDFFLDLHEEGAERDFVPIPMTGAPEMEEGRVKIPIAYGRGVRVGCPQGWTKCKCIVE